MCVLRYVREGAYSLNSRPVPNSLNTVESESYIGQWLGLGDEANYKLGGG